MKRLSRDIWVSVCYNEARKKKEGSGDMQNMQDMKRKRTAVVAGHICLDITPVFHNSAKEINQILMPGKIVNVDAAEIHSGGAVANTGLAMQFFDIDTKLMGILTPFPREVIQKFSALYQESPEQATDWYYDFSCNTDYIRRYRIQKDMRWNTAPPGTDHARNLS